MDQERQMFFGKDLLTLELKTSDLLELAAWMERTGTEYYRYLADHTDDPRVKQFFHHLMGMEHEHEGHIMSLYQQAANRRFEDFGTEGDFTGLEFLQRVRQVAQKKVWPGGFDPSVEVGEKFEIRECLQKALDAEKNSAALYHYLSTFKLDGEARTCIERLMRDEQGHIRDIIDVLNRLPQAELPEAK